ncbi:hypothetical protein SCACP_28540 [Sporomusa carbonis]
MNSEKIFRLMDAILKALAALKDLNVSELTIDLIWIDIYHRHQHFPPHNYSMQLYYGQELNKIIFIFSRIR